MRNVDRISWLFAVCGIFLAMMGNLVYLMTGSNVTYCLVTFTIGAAFALASMVVTTLSIICTKD